MTAYVARTQTFKVAGFTAEVSMPPLKSGSVSSAIVEWSPHVPDFDRDFTAVERADYRIKLLATIVEMSR